MAVVRSKLSVKTKGHTDIIDITPQVSREIENGGQKDGTAIVFVSGSTAALTTIEYEPGLVGDLAAAFERLVPRDMPYAHDTRWGDGNGYAHVRASLLGASLTVPFSGGKMLLGVWQQIVLVDFDNRPRNREIIVQLIGE